MAPARRHLPSLGLLVVAAAAQQQQPDCPSGASTVGSASLFGCVDGDSGQLLRVGAELPPEGGGRRRRSLVLDVRGRSAVGGSNCSEVLGSARLQRVESDESDVAGPRLVASRTLRCGTDGTWHPDSRTRSVTVTDQWFTVPAPTGEGRQLPSLGWNATWSSDEPDLWTAPLTSSLTLANFSKSPLVWVGGPSSSKDALAANFTPLLPRRLGDCDGVKCSTVAQPCPGHPGRTFCLSNVSSGQCDSPSVPCPPCPAGGALAGTCKYWYGGALTDLQWRQALIDHHAQRSELLDAPSMALPIAALLDRATSAGISFHQSARDHPVSMTLTTAPGPSGAVFAFDRQYHRLGGGAAPVTFSQFLILHEDCFRPALRWFDASFPDVLRVHPNIDRGLVDGQSTWFSYHGDDGFVPSAAAAKNAARSDIAIVKMAMFGPFHGVWGPYEAILPSGGANSSARWSTCIGATSTVNASKEVPTCWNPSYKELKEWYQKVPAAFGGGKAFTYVNWL